MTPIGDLQDEKIVLLLLNLTNYITISSYIRAT